MEQGEWNLGVWVTGCGPHDLFEKYEHDSLASQ